MTTLRGRMSQRNVGCVAKQPLWLALGFSDPGCFSLVAVQWFDFPLALSPLALRDEYLQNLRHRAVGAPCPTGDPLGFPPTHTRPKSCCIRCLRGQKVRSGGVPPPQGFPYAFLDFGPKSPHFRAILETQEESGWHVETLPG